MADLATIIAQLNTELQAYSLDGYVVSSTEGDSSYVRERMVDLLNALRESRAQQAADDLAAGTKRPIRLTGIKAKRT